MGSLKDLLHGVYQPGGSRHDDPATSHEAADSINANQLELRVWRAAWAAGQRGLTADEAAEATGLDFRSVTPRFKPLRDKGVLKLLLDGSGEVVKRKGHSRRSQQVHIAVVIPPPLTFI